MVIKIFHREKGNGAAPAAGPKTNCEGIQAILNAQKCLGITSPVSNPNGLSWVLKACRYVQRPIRVNDNSIANFGQSLGEQRCRTALDAESWDQWAVTIKLATILYQAEILLEEKEEVAMHW